MTADTLEVLLSARSFRRQADAWPTWDELALIADVSHADLLALRNKHLFRVDARDGKAVLTSLAFALLKQRPSAAIPSMTPTNSLNIPKDHDREDHR